MFSKDYYHSCITLISTQATDKSLWLCGCYTKRFCTFGYTMNPVWFLFECNIKSYSSVYKHIDWHKQSDRSSYAHVIWGGFCTQKTFTHPNSWKYSKWIIYLVCQVYCNYLFDTGSFRSSKDRESWNTMRGVTATSQPQNGFNITL